ncbi:MAG TPA: response regulator [Myxococcales bacterium]|jgi:DNA-binding response OmpR family regulator
MAQVLVADRDPKVVRILEAVLERRGHRVSLLSEGGDRQRHSREGAPDAFVCSDDLCNGPSLAREIRAANPKARILLLSQGLHTEAFAQAASPALCYVVRKPWSYGELSEALDLVLRDEPAAL